MGDGTRESGGGLSEGERMKEGGKYRLACPGLPSPSGVHLVTHPLHRAEYMRGREGEEERDGAGERQRDIHSQAHWLFHSITLEQMGKVMNAALE